MTFRTGEKGRTALILLLVWFVMKIFRCQMKRRTSLNPIGIMFTTPKQYFGFIWRGNSYPEFFVDWSTNFYWQISIGGFRCQFLCKIFRDPPLFVRPLGENGFSEFVDPRAVSDSWCQNPTWIHKPGVTFSVAPSPGTPPLVMVKLTSVNINCKYWRNLVTVITFIVAVVTFTVNISKLHRWHTGQGV